jgi:hypothetical protein
MSVFVYEKLVEKDVSVESVLKNHEGFGLVGFQARLARERQQGVAYEEVPNGPPGHAVVFGRKTASVQKAFSRNCEWVVRPVSF